MNDGFYFSPFREFNVITQPIENREGAKDAKNV